MNLIENIECDHIGNTPLPNEQELGRGITKISGIYKIINKIDGKYYVGSSQDINKRWNSHLNKLNKNNHINIHLQRAWNKYGKNSFQFSIWKECPIHKLFELEQVELDFCKLNPNLMYNISVCAKSTMRGRKHTENTKLKIGNFGKGKTKSEETRKMISNGLKGKTKSEIHRINLSISNMGKKFNNERLLKHRITVKRGIKHPRYNPTIFKWFNYKYNILEECSQRTLVNKYKLSPSHISRLASGKLKSSKCWTLRNSLQELIEEKQKINQMSQMGIQSGHKNPRYDHTIYNWYNSELNINEKCTRHNIQIKYDLTPCQLGYLIQKKITKHRGWIIQFPSSTHNILTCKQ